MAADEKRLLLVEGIADESFYRAIISKYGLNASVHVATPKSQGGDYNSKNGAINHLPILMKNLEDGSKERIGLVVDADLKKFGQGFDATLELVVEKIKPLGFDTQPVALTGGGFVFEHNDGLPSFGLWIMPNNKDEGILEDLIKDSIVKEEAGLLQNAINTVSSLPSPKFEAHRRVKAEIGTWLAWQDKPAEGLYYSVAGNLLDQDATTMAGFLSWMKHVFNN